jgi:hypothetical protein
VSEWRPIETAPKKWGGFILMFGRMDAVAKDVEMQSISVMGHSGATYVGCWSPAHERWVVPQMMPPLNVVRNNWVDVEPTHWMPLPEFPQ